MGTPTTEVENVTQAFLAEVQKRGLPHVLQWIGEWYGRTARAEAEDNMASVLGEHAKDPEVREAHLIDYLMSEAGMVSNYSTGAGTNLYRQAKVAVHAEMLNESLALLGRKGRRERWEAIRARLDAEATIKT